MAGNSRPPIINKDRREVNGVYLTPRTWNLAEILLANVGKVVHYETLRAADHFRRSLKGRRIPANEVNAMHTALRALRIALLGTGYSIRCVYGVGYEITGPSKTASQPARTQAQPQPKERQPA